MDDSRLVAFRKALARIAKSEGRPRRAASAGANGNGRPHVEELGHQAVERFRRHMNPAMFAVGGGFVVPFVKGRGTRVWDAAGKEYLDFVAGYGALNLGHNHAAVVAAVHAALADEAPGFSPAAINPWAAALAEQLATVAPPGLEMVFFANSGSEAVEAALKLARRATGRRGLLYCERSFHGKTLGSLSVTGNRTYQRPFEPLVPECEAIPFGDPETLERALASRRFAALVVEPVQAEGGMIVPPADYLSTAQTLCRKTETLLIVDEVQTGLGRTGHMFAVDGLRVEPDVMAVAKSLSGGLIPIGAMLARRDLWMKAYGTLDRFALHTSTFGGGSLACAAGLATLKVLRETDVIANAAARGRQLLGGLQPLVARYPLVKDLRGQGLLIGIEFNPPPESIRGRLQGLLAGGASTFLVPGIEGIQQALTATYVVALLLQEHGIYAASRPLQSPFVARGAAAHRDGRRGGASSARSINVAPEVQSLYSTFDQTIAKAVLGEHGQDAKSPAAGSFVAAVLPEGPPGSTLGNVVGSA